MLHGFIGKCGQWCRNKAAGLLVLRVVLGLFFIAHGATKLQSLEVMRGFFASIGFPGPWAAIVAVTEILSGTAFLLGAFLWPAAAAVGIVMAVAIWKVTGPNPQAQPFVLHFISAWGPNVVYAAAAFCLAFCGAGRWSLTAWWMRRKSMGCRDCKAAHGLGHDCPDCPPHHA